MLFITGCPQSGQTILATHLKRFGLNTSPGAKPENDYLDPVVQSINNDILKLSRCSWCDVPNTVDIFSNGAIEYRISVFLNKHPEIQFLKDPRFTFTFPTWKPFFSDPDFLITFREPGETARSLHSKFGLCIVEGLNLWRSYYSRIAHFKAAFVEFGSDVEFEDYIENLDRAFRFLELDVPASPISEIWRDDKLNSRSTGSIPVPIKKLYHLLQHRTEN